MGNMCCDQVQNRTYELPLPMVSTFQPVVRPPFKIPIVHQRYDSLKHKFVQQEDDLIAPGLKEWGPKRDKARKFVYEGTWRGDIFEGKGNVYFDNGEFFFGEFKNGRANGQGTFIFQNGDYYQGNVVNNTADGQGIYNGIKQCYQGEWKNSKPTIGIYRNKTTDTIVDMQTLDKGTIQWANGNRYMGQIDNLYPNGQGQMTFFNGNEYNGQWNNGVFEGYGTFTWSDGKTYIGQYKNGVKHGRGQFNYLNNRKYQGQWQNGQQQGRGKLSQGDQVLYEGVFANGVANQGPSSPKSQHGSYVDPTKVPESLTFYNTQSNHPSSLPMRSLHQPLKNGTRESYNN